MEDEIKEPTEKFEVPETELRQSLRLSGHIRKWWRNLRCIGRKSINESMQLQNAWYEEAKKITPKTLPAFIKKLTKGYNHDYGTICHAVTAAALAGAHAVNHSEQGGITGFQAGCIMWQFIGEWGIGYKGKPLRLISYDRLLYPQYENHFDKVLDEGTWTWLQKEAKKNLEECRNTASPNVVAHWQSIVDGNVPFGFAVVKE